MQRPFAEKSPLSLDLLCESPAVYHIKCVNMLIDGPETSVFLERAYRLSISLDDDVAFAETSKESLTSLPHDTYHRQPISRRHYGFLYLPIAHLTAAHIIVWLKDHDLFYGVQRQLPHIS